MEQSDWSFPRIDYYVNEGIHTGSRILTEKRDQVAKAIENCGFLIEEIKEDGMWCAIVAALPVEKR